MNLADSKNLFQQIENVLLHQDIGELQRVVKSAVNPEHYTEDPASRNE